MITTLHVDIEGGWGGSSRSLFEVLSRLDRSRITPVVVHARSGPVVQRYAAIGIKTYHVPEVASYVPRQRALAELAVRAPALIRIGAAARRILQIAGEHRAGVIHLNYEGLALLARTLRRRSSLPIVIHCRASRISQGLLGRWLARLIAGNANHLFFIGPKEQEWYQRCSPDNPVPAHIVWNIAAAPVMRRPLDQPPRIVYLGNIDPSKGVDRIVEVAQLIEARNAPPAEFHVFGSPRTNPQYAEQLAAGIVQKGLSHRVKLRGFTEDASAELAGALALLRPSLWDDPWGRDVIEATAAGCPVIATGTFDGVVKHGITGFLVASYDPAVVAGHIEHLLRDPLLWQSMSKAATGAAGRFDGSEQVRTVTEVLEQLAHEPRR